MTDRVSVRIEGDEGCVMSDAASDSRSTVNGRRSLGLRVFWLFVLLDADRHEAATNEIQPRDRAARRPKRERVVRACFNPDSTICRQNSKGLIRIPELRSLELVRLRRGELRLGRHGD